MKKLWTPKPAFETSEHLSGNADPNMITREFENLNSFPIVFTSMRNDENPAWTRFECMPGEFVHLPHALYIAWNLENRNSQEQIKVHIRYGNDRKTRCPFPVRTGFSTHDTIRKIKTSRES